MVQKRTDRAGQEDRLRRRYSGARAVAIEQATPIDLTRESNGDLGLIVDYRITARPAAGAIGMADAATIATVLLTAPRRRMGDRCGAAWPRAMAAMMVSATAALSQSVTATGDG